MTIAKALPVGTHRGPLVRTRCLLHLNLQSYADLHASLVEAAEQAGSTISCSIPLLKSIETGRRRVSDDLKPLLAAAYRVHPNDLIRTNPVPDSPIGSPLVPIRVLRRPTVQFPTGLTLEDLARVIAEAAYRLGKDFHPDESTLTNVELGVVRPSPLLLHTWAMALGISRHLDIAQAPAPRRGRRRAAVTAAA